MAGEAASALGLSMAVLAQHPDDAACSVAAEVVVGSPFVEGELRALCERCGVVTFDHDQVDLDIVARLSAEGYVLRPGAATLEFAVDKAHMRTELDRAGVPVPAYAVFDNGPDAAKSVGRFAQEHGWPVMLKAARGGYDGKGVWPVADQNEVVEVLSRVEGSVVVEELLTLDAELAVMVARRPSGSAAAWPAVETAQVGGVCREVLVPGRLPSDVVEAATGLGQKVAEIAGAVGVMAIELFWSEGRLLVNEVATRPHNSGHWTIEGAVTSQFEQHLRAVLNLPLGSPALASRYSVMVNILGGEDPDLRSRLTHVMAADPAVKVHLYGKPVRPGRKVGHVTALGRDLDQVRGRARRAASYLADGTEDEGDFR
jgi:5-(carboxyamino)imidazole ribonucleotide synthase